MIYVIDDAVDYRFLVQQVFKRFLPQYPLRLFSDGLKLIQLVESDPGEPDLILPGLIVLDVDMPKLDGFQTLERLKSNSRWCPIPVVMMSNRSDSSFETAVLALGANSYIIKPMDIHLLHAVLKQLCQQWLGE